MHVPGFKHSQTTDESADMKDREGVVDPRESFTMPLGNDTDESCQGDNFVPPGLPDQDAARGAQRGTDCCRRRRCGRRSWCALDDIMVHRFKRRRSKRDSSSDSDTSSSSSSSSSSNSSGGSGSSSSSSDSSDLDAAIEAVEDDLQKRVVDGDYINRDNEGALSDGKGHPPSPCTRHHRRHHRHHSKHGRRHGGRQKMKHHGAHVPPLTSHPFFTPPVPGAHPMCLLFGDSENKHCRKSTKKAMKESFKAHKKAWKKCVKKGGKKRFLKSDGECVHSDDFESHDDHGDRSTSSHLCECSRYHRHRHRGQRHCAAKKKHCKGKCGQDQCKHGKVATKKKQQHSAKQKPCDVIDDDTMLLDGDEHHTNTEMQSSLSKA